MALEVVGNNIIPITIIVAAIAISLLAYFVYNEIKSRKNFSFRNAFDLIGLPVLVFKQGDVKLKFILDTGSSVSVIDEKSIANVQHDKLDKADNMVDANGGERVLHYCNFKFTCEDKEFENEFMVNDMSNIKRSVKESSGVDIDGLVGSDFFNKYKYVIDFNKYLAYSKK